MKQNQAEMLGSLLQKLLEEVDAYVRQRWTNETVPAEAYRLLALQSRAAWAVGFLESVLSLVTDVEAPEAGTPSEETSSAGVPPSVVTVSERGVV